MDRQHGIYMTRGMFTDEMVKIQDSIDWKNQLISSLRHRVEHLEAAVQGLLQLRNMVEVDILEY